VKAGDNDKTMPGQPRNMGAAEMKLMSIFMDWIKGGGIISPRILDFGCGIGNYSRIFAEYGYTVTAVEIDHESLKYLKGQDTSGSIIAICGDITTEIFKEGVLYDVIIISEVMEHLDRPQEVLQIVGRHLSDNGFAIFTIPNGYGPWEIYNRIASRPLLHKIIYAPFYFPIYIKNLLSKQNVQIIRKKRIHCTMNSDSPHIHFWTFNKFLALLKEYGFKMREVRNSNISYKWMPYYYRIKNSKLDFIDVKVADYLPHFMVSGWIFKVSKNR